MYKCPPDTSMLNIPTVATKSASMDQPCWETPDGKLPRQKSKSGYSRAHFASSPAGTGKRSLSSKSNLTFFGGCFDRIWGEGIQISSNIRLCSIHPAAIPLDAVSKSRVILIIPVTSCNTALRTIAMDTCVSKTLHLVLGMSLPTGQLVNSMMALTKQEYILVIHPQSNVPQRFTSCRATSGAESRDMPTKSKASLSLSLSLYGIHKNIYIYIYNIMLSVPVRVYIFE